MINTLLRFRLLPPKTKEAKRCIAVHFLFADNLWVKIRAVSPILMFLNAYDRDLRLVLYACPHIDLSVKEIHILRQFVISDDLIGLQHAELFVQCSIQCRVRSTHILALRPQSQHTDRQQNQDQIAQDLLPARQRRQLARPPALCLTLFHRNTPSPLTAQRPPKNRARPPHAARTGRTADKSAGGQDPTEVVWCPAAKTFVPVRRY